MAKVIKVDNGNGTFVFVKKDLKGKEDGISLCSQCPKRNKDSRYSNCHISNKIYELEMLFGLKLPVLECPSYNGEFEDVADAKPVQVEKDSTEEEV